jgi:hypothetical protein
MEMNLTIKKLEKLGACSGAREKFLSQKETDVKKIITSLLDYNIIWANWLIVRLMTHRQKIRYAIYAAELVIDLYEKKYPEDQRPRNAINTAKAYLKNPSIKNKNAAYAAANAAYAAAYAAYAAAYAANAAYAAANAAYAAYAATNAAYAAYAAANAVNAVYATYAAAYAAYAAANAVYARKGMEKKIILYGLKLLKL